MVLGGLEFRTKRVRLGVFSYEVRRPNGQWVLGSDYIHGRMSEERTRQALLHYGKMDLERAEAAKMTQRLAG